MITRGIKKIVSLIVVCVFLASSFSVYAESSDPVTLYLFHSESCPHCQKERVFLNSLDTEQLNLQIREFEISKDVTNAMLFKKVGEALDIDVRGVPLTIVGDQIIHGYRSDETTGKEIVKAIEQARTQPDQVAPVLENKQHESSQSSEKQVDSISVPLIGEINPLSFSLPLLTIVIAAVDGFNPCAMWVLVFLISLLIGMKDRRRMWVLGGAFIVSSALVYFLFLSAWLNLLLFIGFIVWVRGAVGLVAVGAGTYYLYEFFTNKDQTCAVTGSEQKKKIIDRLKAIMQEKHFWVALAGIILLAFAVNLIEAICSAGLPAVYTQILTMNNLPLWQYYVYLLLYIIVFMLDDLLVFFIAMKTLQTANLGTNYVHLSRIIGGIVLLLIGLAMLFKPEFIMFG